MSVSVSEWSRLSWKLEEGDEAAYGAGDEGLWLVTQAATTGWPQLSPWILCLVLGLRWVVGALAGLPSYCWDRKPKKITRCPQVAERLQQRGKDSFRTPRLGPHNASVSTFATEHSSPGDFACSSPCLCLFFLVCRPDFRWGTLKSEQARDVCTKSERQVQLFLS